MKGPRSWRVALVGSFDLDQNLGLIRRLRPDFEALAVGSRPALGQVFARQGFRFRAYPLQRKVSPLSDLVSLGRLF
ncbi:MAG: hypothetical protein JRJ59_03010 [Deltaproteobacteria bacterium]|nr:hypothetical protein [Deltaproteobacteria bacterium]